MSAPGLCHRCEYRAAFHESGERPRAECGDVGRSVCACYMYRPVRPVALDPARGERRVLGIGWGLAGRAGRSKSQPAMLLATHPHGKRGILQYWTPAAAPE